MISWISSTLFILLIRSKRFHCFFWFVCLVFSRNTSKVKDRNPFMFAYLSSELQIYLSSQCWGALHESKLHFSSLKCVDSSFWKMTEHSCSLVKSTERRGGNYYIIIIIIRIYILRPLFKEFHHTGLYIQQRNCYLITCLNRFKKKVKIFSSDQKNLSFLKLKE